MKTPQRKTEIEKRMRELQVQQEEFKTLKKDAKVYKQQPNSNILFREQIPDVWSKAKKELDDLMKEYKTYETSAE